LDGFPPGESPFLANVPERCSNLLYKRRPCTSFLPNLVRFPSSLFLLANAQQNSLLFYLGAAFSGRPCHHHPLLVPNHPPLVPTTRQNMPAAQNNPSCINVNLPTDMCKTSLPNLLYPIRPIHTPWVEPSAPLVITVRYFQWLSCRSLTFFRVQKTESLRYQTSFVYSNGSSGVSRNSHSYFSRTYPLFSSSLPPMTPLSSCESCDGSKNWYVCQFRLRKTINDLSRSVDAVEVQASKG
jgi:hypothetical protein